MDNKTQERIKADAEAYMHAFVKGSVKYEDIIPNDIKDAHIAGATAEHDRAQGELKDAQAAARMFCNKHNETATQLAEVVDRAQVLADALEWIKTYGPCDELTVKFIDKQLEQWKGTGKEETKPEPEGCPYCGSATCTSDHK